MTTYQPQPGLSPAVDAHGMVITDLPCRKCGYNLRTLSLAGRCPECGTAVGYSAQGDLLRFSDPGWVMTLHRGVVMMLIGAGVIILGVILTMVLGIVMGTGPAGVLAALAGLGGYVLIVVGTWLLTAPDPSGLGEDRYGTARKVIRVTLLIGVAAQVAELLDAGFVLPETLMVVLNLAQTVAGIAGVVGIFAQLQYIGKLALRIPDDRIAGRANVVKWGFGISYGIIYVGGAIIAMLMPGGGGQPGGAATSVGCFMAVAGLVMFVFAILYLLLLDRLRRALKEQADFATGTWAAATT